MLRNKTVFLISPEDWNFVFVSKHHYAMELAKRGNKVFFINPPRKGKPGSLAITPVNDIQNLYIVDYTVWFRGLRFFPAFLMRWVERRFLNKVENISGLRFDVVWNFENSRFYDMRFTGPKVLKLYFQVDDDQTFHPSTAASTADLSFAINSEIFDSISSYNENSFIIPHSFQGHLSPGALKVVNGEYLYKKPEGPITIVYVGNLEHGYINKELFEEVVKHNSGIQFKLIGPYDPQKELFHRLQKYSNVHFQGKVPFNEIPALLDMADALMLVYGKGFNFSSHKLLEYLGSGKTIISTYMSAYANFPELVNMSRSDDEYLYLFSQVINDIESQNSLTKMRARIEFAMEHTYSRQLDKIDNIIEQVINNK